MTKLVSSNLALLALSWLLFLGKGAAMVPKMPRDEQVSSPANDTNAPPPPPHEFQEDASSSFWSVDPSRTFFRKMADTYYIVSQSALDLRPFLPIGFYTVGWDDFRGEYYLKEILPFDLSGKKIYGDTEAQADRIIDTFQSRSGKSTGVLLAGQKGSGKTLLAKYISVQAAAKLGISTIVINEPWSGEKFNAFIQSIQQPCIVLFDEFEKIYRQSEALAAAEAMGGGEGRMYGHHGRYYEEGMERSVSNPSQDSILTLLDGVYPSQMLFVLTVNDKSKITSNMMNRPGRIFYVLDFSGVDTNFVRDYCEDRLQNATYIPEVVSYASLFEAFSFDMLQSLVEEMNRSGESPAQATKWLNINLETAGSRREPYKIQQIIYEGADVTSKLQRPHWDGNPVTSNVVEINIYGRTWMGYKDWTLMFSPQSHLVSGNLTSGEYVFEDPIKKSKAVLVRFRRASPATLARVIVT